MLPASGWYWPSTPPLSCLWKDHRCLEYFIISQYICIISISQWTCHNHDSGVELGSSLFDAASMGLVLAQSDTTVIMGRPPSLLLIHGYKSMCHPSIPYGRKSMRCLLGWVSQCPLVICCCVISQVGKSKPACYLSYNHSVMHASQCATLYL